MSVRATRAPISRPELEDRIVKRFSAVARRQGPGAVIMADLARELGISTKTLYRVFPSKADLVRRMMEVWAEGLERRLRDDQPVDDDGDEGGEPRRAPFVDHLLHASTVWEAQSRRFGNSFWVELERDYPASYELVTEARGRLRERLAARLEAHVKPGIPALLALELFDAGLSRALDRETQRRYGLDTRGSIRTAVRVWAEGALSEPLRRRRGE